MSPKVVNDAPRTRVDSRRTRDGRDWPPALTRAKGRRCGLRIVIVQSLSVSEPPWHWNRAVWASGRRWTLTIRSRPLSTRFLPSTMTAAGCSQTTSSLGGSMEMIGRNPSRARISRDSPESAYHLPKKGPPVSDLDRPPDGCLERLASARASGWDRGGRPHVEPSRSGPRAGPESASSPRRAHNGSSSSGL